MKKILSFVLAIIVLFTLSGCSSKEGVTPSDFETIMKDNGFYVNTITDDVIATNMKTAKIADNKKYQIEYYSFVSNSDAENAFKSNKKMIEASKGKTNKEVTLTESDYEFYSLESNEKYNLVSRSGNTMIYVYANIEYKKEIKEIIKKINY